MCNKVEYCRTGHSRCLRKRLIEEIGEDKVASMPDEEVGKWFEDEGYQTYIAYFGEYDDSDSILVAKPSDIFELVKSGKAFWLNR